MVTAGLDRRTRGHGRQASDTESLSPYVERPSIPEGVTVDQYRRARPPHTKPLMGHLLGWLSVLRPARASTNGTDRRHPDRRRNDQRSSMVACAESGPGAGP
jgi:hypothetical protein